MAKKKELPPLNIHERLAAKLAESALGFETAEDVLKNAKYIDFCDPKTGLPTLSQEWFLGSRGFLRGRSTVFRAAFSAGKSTYLYSLYGAAQRQYDALCLHIETEGAAAPPDRVKKLGANPKSLTQRVSNSLDDCFEAIDTYVCSIRGGFGGSVGATGRILKTRFTDPLDADMVYPILIGVDSLSELAMNKDSSIDVMDASKVTGVAETARVMRRFFKNRAQRFATSDVTLFITAHETAKITQGPGYAAGDDKTFIAEKAVGGGATFGISMRDPSKWYNKSTGDMIGDILHLRTFKNKWSPRYRTLDLYSTERDGIDFIHTDADFLLNSDFSPFKNKQFQLLDANGNPYECLKTKGITCTALRDKTKGQFANEEEFVRAFYENEDLVMTCRERMRIRGWGHDWETKYEGPDDVAQQDAEYRTESEKSKDFMPDDFDQ